MFFSSRGWSFIINYANTGFQFKLLVWTDPGLINAGCDIVLLDLSHCYLMRPLFGITEAAVQSYTGIQACWDRMAQSVFCPPLFSLLFSLSLSAERGVDAHPADLLHLTLFLFVRMAKEALQKLVVECMVLTMASVLFLRLTTESFSRFYYTDLVYRTWFKSMNPVT